jgi:hypothetical protein
MLMSLGCIRVSGVQAAIQTRRSQSKIFLDTRRRDRRYDPLKDQHHLHRAMALLRATIVLIQHCRLW